MDDYYGFPTENAQMSYERKGQTIVLHVHMVGNEFRTVLLGLWASLEEDQRIDMIQELSHYLFNRESMPSVAIAISKGLAGEEWSEGDEFRTVDINKRKREEFGEE